MTIRPCPDPDVLSPLVPQAEAEGFDHLRRLVAEWTDGTNRFEGEGECLLVVATDGEVVACGGLTRQSETLGRIRRVYVDPAHRRRGVARALMDALLTHARGKFEGLVLYAENPAARRLYEGLGFVPEDPTSTPDHATHRLHLHKGATGV